MSASSSPLPTTAAGRFLRRFHQRRDRLSIVTRHVDLRRRGSSLGLRIVLVADIHARADWFPPPCVELLVDTIRAVDDVDLVAMVGDFTGDDPAAIEGSASEYARIDAPVVASLGNHDHWADAPRATSALEAAGVHVLTNRAVPASSVLRAEHAASDDLWFVGIDSCWTRRGSGPGADPVAAFADVPGDAEAVVLGHEPHIATMHEQALHLAGHTHCGQVRTPIFGDWTARMHMPRFSGPYPCRLYELPVTHRPGSSPLHDARVTSRDRRWVYTTAGVGYSTVDFRLFCPSEIVVLDV